MAEVFGIVSGAINVAQAFSTCLEVFNYVQVGRNFGIDYQTSQLQLAALQQQLSRWGAGVDIYRNPQLAGSGESAVLVNSVLTQILVLFDKSNEVSSRFALQSEGDTPPLSSLSPSQSSNLRNKMSTLVRQRQKQMSPPQNHALGRPRPEEAKRAHPRPQIVGVDPGTAIPAPIRTRDNYPVEEITQVVHGNEEEMGTLKKAVKELDNELLKAKIPGHTYKNISIVGEESVAVMNGNLNPGHKTGKGASHTYDGITIKGGKDVRVVNGDVFQQNGFFK